MYISQRTRQNALLNHDSEHDIKKKDHCEICHTKFINLIKTPHLCKRCYRTVCADCGERQIIQGGLQCDDKAHRFCNICKIDQSFVQNLISKYKLKWGYDSIVGLNWLSHIKLDIDQEKNRKEYLQNLQNINSNRKNQMYDSQSYAQFMSDISKNYGKKEAYTYSLHDMLMFIQQNVEIPQTAVSNVMKVFLYTHPQIGYSTNMVSLINFLLCFCSEAVVFQILKFVYTKIIPEELWPSSVEEEFLGEGNVQKYIDQQTKNISQILCVQIANQNIISDFLKENFFNYYTSLFVNFLSVEVTFNLIEYILRYNQFEDILKMMQIIIQINFQTLAENQRKLSLVNEYILKYTNINQVNKQRKANKMQNQQNSQRSNSQQFQNSLPSSQNNSFNNTGKNIHFNIAQSPQVNQQQQLQQNQFQQMPQQTQQQKQQNDQDIPKDSIIKTKEESIKTNDWETRERQRREQEKQTKEKLEEQIAILRSEIDYLKLMVIKQKDEKISELQVLNQSLEFQMDSLTKENQMISQKLEQEKQQNSQTKDKFLSQYEQSQQIHQKIQQDEQIIQRITNEKDHFKKQSKQYFQQQQIYATEIENFNKKIIDLKKENLKLTTQCKIQQRTIEESNKKILEIKKQKEKDEKNKSFMSDKDSLEFFRLIGGKLEQTNKTMKQENEILKDLEQITNKQIEITREFGKNIQMQQNTPVVSNDALSQDQENKSVSSQNSNQIQTNNQYLQPPTINNFGRTVSGGQLQSSSNENSDSKVNQKANTSKLQISNLFNKPSSHIKQMSNVSNVNNNSNNGNNISNNPFATYSNGNSNSKSNSGIRQLQISSAEKSEHKQRKNQSLNGPSITAFQQQLQQQQQQNNQNQQQQQQKSHQKNAQSEQLLLE